MFKLSFLFKLYVCLTYLSKLYTTISDAGHTFVSHGYHRGVIGPDQASILFETSYGPPKKPVDEPGAFNEDAKVELWEDRRSSQNVTVQLDEKSVLDEV